MLDDIWKKVYPHIYKKPCNICLVKAKCENASVLKRKRCDLKLAWRSREYKVETFLNNVEVVLFGIVFILGIILFVATFFLGFWKWYDIGRMLFS